MRLSVVRKSSIYLNSDNKSLKESRVSSNSSRSKVQNYSPSRVFASRIKVEK